MNNRVDLVEKITPWRESWKVHVKVVKLWYHKNPALDPSQNLLHMVLMDEKLHKIQATIRDQLILKFSVSLNEGDVYLMTHFTVVPNTALNRVTKHRFRLLFQYNTSVVSVVSPRIPHSGLCFASIDEIDQMTKEHNFLIGSYNFLALPYFVGIITGVRKERDVASYGKLVKAVVVEVFADGKRVQCNVFGNACDLLEYDKLQKYPRSPLVVLESFKIKVIKGGVILQNVINVSRLFINSDIPESVEFLSRLVVIKILFSVASYGFSRLVTNDLGYLVSKVDGDYFNPKEITNIQDLHSDNGDSHYFVIGTIKEVMDEPDWWYYTCMCGHAVVEHEDLYLCDACGSCVEHIMVKYGIQVKIQDGGCTGLFVLLDNAVCRSYSPQMFDDAVGEEKVFKVEIDSAVDPDYSSCFKIAMLYGPIFSPIYDSYLQYATGEDYKTQVVCDNAIQLETIEDIITNLISLNRCYSDVENGGFVFILGTISSVLKNHKWWGSYCKVVPLKLISSLLHKKVVFMVDARPVGYEMNRSVYIVQQIWDDASVINVFEAATEMNEHKIHVLVDSMHEVEDAFSQCRSDHEAVEVLVYFGFITLFVAQWVLWNINSHLPHNFLLPYRDLSPIFLFSPFASCCHSRVPASFFSVVVVTPIGRSASSTRFLYPHAVRVSGSFLGLSEFSLRRKTVHQGYPLRSTFSVPNVSSEQYSYHHHALCDLFPFV
ncbi:hypothetical protein Ahy_B04g070692 isoform A [Arachis hypogaea]|uniref:Replication protein A 70 kDa DNA-binding subunit B/D first OB fold domain-containing protein n=1 Tax=Arachis hypogaea TaxID=3818 RepID=A0A444ZIG8_ARAHY|nr:hypothetical protein Ahy_B04g070692 isoform A [Arachis hypogaea]